MPRLASCIALAALAAAPALAADSGKFFSDGKVGVEVRYRYEGVDQSDFALGAKANTARFRLTLASGTVGGFSAVVEGDDLESIGPADFNSTRNGHTGYPQVADPPAFDLNQLYFQYAGLPKTVLKLGRQRIKFDNERFVGPVGWRQNEQTYDAFSIENKALPKTTITYAYIDEVRRVFGPDDPYNANFPTATFEGGIHAFNLRYSGLPAGAVTVYDYYLGIDNQPVTPRPQPELASNTVGLRYDGSHKAGQKGVFNWALEYAWQNDVKDNPANVDAHYSLVEIGGKYGPVGFTVGQEVLSGKQGTFTARLNPAFQTPLATLHKFQGWADKFLTTPSAGIEDLYIGATATYAGFNAAFTWHDFQAEATGLDYGQERDMSLSRKFGKHYEVLLKYADFNADQLTTVTETSKIWLMVTATFPVR